MGPEIGDAGVQELQNGQYRNLADVHASVSLVRRISIRSDLRIPDGRPATAVRQ